MTPRLDLPDWFEPAVAALLSCEQGIDFQPLAGGANNRVYRVQSGETKCVLKWYFTDPEDSRDRFHSEWSFLRFAQRHGIDEAPQPIAADSVHRLAAFEFIEGVRPEANGIGQIHVQSALRFLHKLNEHRESTVAADLPAGSEACLSIEQHVACIRKRVERLQHASLADGFSVEIAERIIRIQHQLNAIHCRIERQIRNQLVGHHDSFETALSSAERIISPSDFGFHNSLIDRTGRVRFIDFEYAGWDDPAKTICDFFCQLAVPVPINYWPAFCSTLHDIGLASASPRAELLLPAYRLKWCCIVLNPLLRVGRNRRAFSGHDATSETYIVEECVSKAERLLSELR